jgi:hypothetical protein
MKKVSLSLLAAVLAFNFIGASSARADEGRVINDELVLKDPTVANPKNFLVGGALEGWFVTGPYNTSQNGATVAQGTINGGLFGENFFVGYGPLTLQYTHREGGFNVTSKYVTNGLVTVDSEQQNENEITARYLFKVSKHFNPYAIAGYNSTRVTENNVLQSGTWLYGNTVHGPVSNSRNTYNSSLWGVGAIIPFNQRWGARADARLLFTSGKFVRDDGLSTTGSGVGGAFTATGYVNIIQGLNFQAGFNEQVLNAGPNVASFARFGIFGSLGYSYKF